MKFNNIIEKLNFYIQPHFMSRWYLYRNIKSINENYELKGKLLDIGCGSKPYKSLFNKTTVYTGIDFPNFSKNKGFKSDTPDKFFSKNYIKNQYLPFASGSFDIACAFQVLEHTENPVKLIKEMARVIKNKGYILLTFPLIWGLHEEPKDFLRYTHYWIKKKLQKNNFKILLTIKEGGIFTTCTTLLTDFLIEIAQKNKIFYVLCLVFYPAILLLSYLSILMDFVLPSKKIFLNYLILAKR